MDLQTKFLTVPGGTLAYDDTGSAGPLVLCTPGLGDVRALYRFLRPLLVEAGYRVVTMDVRGHGESTARWDNYTPESMGDDILALLRHLDAGPAVLVGESYTAASVIWAAAEEPALVSNLVLCGPFVLDNPMPWYMVRIGLLVGSFASLWDMYYNSLYPGDKPADLAEYRKKLKRNMREPGRLFALRRMLDGSKGACEKRIPEVRCPSLVIMGTKDPDFKDPAAVAHALSERLGADLVLQDGVGHYPPAHRPQETATAILTFLRKESETRA